MARKKKILKPLNDTFENVLKTCISVKVESKKSKKNKPIKK